MSDTTLHTPVLLEEVLEGLQPEKGDVIVDGTFGGGGHARALCDSTQITLIALDADKRAIERGKASLESSENKCLVHFVNRNFRHLDTVLEELGLEKINGALFDLGLSSDQLETSGRGFTFKKDEPLLMTFTEDPQEDTVTAEVVVNEWDEENIADILFGFGDEHFSRRIAGGIAEERKRVRISTTGILVRIIEESVPWWYRRRKIHPATKTFQALRMAVNDELGSITQGVEAAFRHCAPGGRIGVITFHSVEDRHVKNLFKEIAIRGATLIRPTPITPGREEQKRNPRSRSAKLRLLEKII
jgi:16S rRNA (cytosine1402-N4)-methyltransferase